MTSGVSPDPKGAPKVAEIDQPSHEGAPDRVPSTARLPKLETPESWGDATKAIHVGASRAVGSPVSGASIIASSTFHLDIEAPEVPYRDYGRQGTETMQILESQVGAFEHARNATVFASGLSAISAVCLSVLERDSLILAEQNTYGCSIREFRALERFGVRAEYVDFADPKNYEEILIRKPRVVWIESPTNPLLKILDIRAIAGYAKAAGSLLVVDNSFASSFFQKPLDLGADISVSSLTKYHNGHSSAMGGAMCANFDEWNGISWKKMSFEARRTLGLQTSSFDAYLTYMGGKTLPLRMKQHQENALAVANYLEALKPLGIVNWVRYPMLPSHPQYEIARRQMTGGSGMVSADFNLTEQQTKRLLMALELFAKAHSLGGVESSISHPWSMSHASVPPEQKRAAGITPSTVRISVGLEDAADLLADIARALPSVSN